jgi:hypothetical protein
MTKAAGWKIEADAMPPNQFLASIFQQPATPS